MSYCDGNLVLPDLRGKQLTLTEVVMAWLTDPRNEIGMPESNIQPKSTRTNLTLAQSAGVAGVKPGVVMFWECCKVSFPSSSFSPHPLSIPPLHMSDNAFTFHSAAADQQPSPVTRV